MITKQIIIKRLKKHIFFHSPIHAIETNGHSFWQLSYLKTYTVLGISFYKLYNLLFFFFFQKRLFQNCYSVTCTRERPRVSKHGPTGGRLYLSNAGQITQHDIF